MKKQITPELITNLTTNLWAFRTLVAAVKLDVFTNIKNKKINVNKDPIQKLLNALVAMKLLVKKGDTYFNLPISDKFLVKTSKTYFGDFILMIAESEIQNWLELDKIVKSKSKRKKDIKQRFANPIFTKAMHNHAQGPANVLSNTIDLSNKNHLLDIGGGSGAFSIILTNKFKNLKATVLEQSKVCKLVLNYIKKEGNIKKINILRGDFLKIKFPKNDVALLSHVLHSNSLKENRFLIKKVYENLDKGGLILVNEFLLNKNKIGPLFSTLFNINMLVKTKEGSAYSYYEIKNWLKEAEFKNIKVKHLVGPHSLISAKK